MYVQGNPRTKKALKELIAAGTARVMSAGMYPAEQNGEEFVEGPHAPAAHAWYAQVKVQNGLITKIIG